jgi:RHS repeat-associated protein
MSFDGVVVGLPKKSTWEGCCLVLPKSIYERTVRGSTTEHVQFIYAGGAHGGSAFAQRVITEEGTAPPAPAAIKYNHFDHLGSITATSDEIGHVVRPGPGVTDPGVMSYDAWGARRAPDGRAAVAASFNLPVGRRGFTGHETIPNVGLVNMNGRVYDPLLGRFLSPDPNVQFAADLQSYNRYSYVLNNPLRYTDPTGYWVNSTFDVFMNIALTATSIAVCTGGGPAGCAIAFAMVATLYNTSSAINSGASFDQVVAMGLAGAVGGAIGGTIGGALTSQLGGELGAQMLGGALAGATSAWIGSTTLGGGQNLGKNMLMGASMGAATAAVAYRLHSMNQVSQASKAEAQGAGGSGEARLTAIERRFAAAGEQGETLESVVSQGGFGDGSEISDDDILNAYPRRRQMSAEGRAFTSEREGGLVRHLYNDRGNNNPNSNATIGVGHLVHRGPIGTDPASEAPFLRGITVDEGEALFTVDLAAKEAAVNRLVGVPISQSQFDALVDFAFNAGQGNLADSELLQRVNVGASVDQIRAGFMAWGGGNRRTWEADMYLNGTYHMNHH